MDCQSNCESNNIWYYNLKLEQHAFNTHSAMSTWKYNKYFKWKWHDISLRPSTISAIKQSKAIAFKGPKERNSIENAIIDNYNCDFTYQGCQSSSKYS